MNRLLRILLMAVLLGPHFGQFLQPVEEVCAEVREDCCEPQGPCDVNCVQCNCCVASPVTLQGAASAEVLDSPPALTAASRAAEPPSAPPSDILHIPKSG